MEKSSFFNSIDGDRKYKAEEWAEYFASLIGNGVFPEPSTNLMVEAYNNMTIKVKAGKAWINGYFYFNTADLTVQLDNADGVLKRIDRIVIRWSLTNRSIQAAVKKGTFASSPVAPALQRDADIYEIALADVLVNNGVIEVTQANITDLRQNSSLCGIVAGTVNQIDASGLFAQYDQIFNDWFANIEAILDENAAANLLNLINTHKADFVAQPANGGNTGGTATAYTCTSTPAPGELVDKIGVIITAHADSGSNPTLNWNALGAKPIKKPNGNAAVLKSGGVYTLRYNATTGNFILQGEGASGNATASDLLSGKTASTDAGDITGTMTNRGSVGVQNLTAEGAEYTIPQGYHNGLGKVKAVIAGLIASVIKAGTTVGGILGTFTSDANATAPEIANGKTAYVNGSKITGTSTAKKSASGVVDNASGNITFNVSNLGFTPSKVIYLITLPTLNWNNVGVISSSNDLAQKQSSALTNKVEILNSNGTAYYNNFTASVAIQAGGFYVNNVGGGAGYPHKMTWFAYE